MKHVTLRSGRKKILQHKYVSGPDDNPHHFRTSPINWNKKKAEVNCSSEDVEFSMQCNEDIRNRNNFSAVWSYCMEQTGSCSVLQRFSLKTDVICIPIHSAWEFRDPACCMGQHSPQTPLSNLSNVLQHKPSTLGFNFSLMGSELPIVTNWALFLSF